MKILIGTPTSDQKNYCFNEFSAYLSSSKHDHLIVDNSRTKNKCVQGLTYRHILFNANIRQSIADAQNIIRDQFLKKDYTHLAFLESDLFPPPGVFDRLALHDKDVAGHPYFVMKGSLRQYMIHNPLYIEESNIWNANPVDVTQGFSQCNGSLQRVHSVGFGCVLIKRHVIEKLSFHINESNQVSDTGHPSSSDSFFYADCALNNIEVYADTSLTVRHYNKDWK